MLRLGDENWEQIKKGDGNTRNGNAYLVLTFIEAANFARRLSVEAKRFFECKRARANQDHRVRLNSVEVSLRLCRRTPKGLTYATVEGPLIRRLGQHGRSHGVVYARVITVKYGTAYLPRSG